LKASFKRGKCFIKINLERIHNERKGKGKVYSRYAQVRDEAMLKNKKMAS
jgi:hypothetical protein